MRRLIRFFLILFSGLSALGALLLFWQILNPARGADYVELLQRIAINPAGRAAALLLMTAIAALGVFMIVYALMSGRLAKSRVMSTEIGDIDVAVEALENIALNAAKAAQAGVKTAKARISQDREKHLIVIMIVVLYSDVEIPAQMAKIQDRVKKDVERYTGIAVSEVQVKVNRVELIGAKVER